MEEHLIVTCVKPLHGFLQIFGHKKPNLLAQLDSQINAYQPAIKKLASQSELYSNLEFDTIYLAHTAGTNKYHRCIVREKRASNKAIIQLIDYGNDFEVDASLLLELDPKNKIAEFLKEFPPIATSYILSHFFCNWKSHELHIVESMLTRATFLITNEQMDRDQRYISFNFKGEDMATKLINSNVGMEISFTEQRLEIKKITERHYNVVMTNVASPARREKRRNLIPTRPLQTSANNNNNNNMITNQSKQMIQNMVRNSNKPNAQRSPIHQDVSVTDGITHSTASRIPAFTANELPGSQFHAVYCSYHEDGPHLFYVQLKSQEHQLDRLCSDLSNAPRIPITTKLSIGMACIARFSEDQVLYRAVIQSVQGNGCRVTFVDYGNSELVPFDDMYEIPNEFLDFKTFAMPFQLHGCKELGTISQPLKNYFASLVGHSNVLDLKVVPSNNLQVHQCELFISNGLNVYNLLKEKKNELNSFPSPPTLKTDDYVIIRAALTANKFYVQRRTDIQAFDEMMDALFAHCHQAPQMTALPPVGKCCAAMANGDDKEWYRAIVLKQLDSERVQVQFVDYGNEMACRLSDLRDITPKFLELPRQAIECCLVDFEDVANVSESTSYQLSMLIDNSNGETIAYKTSMKKRLPCGTYVVDLYDEVKELSVSLSVYKLAMPRRHYSKPTKGVNEVEKPVRANANNRPSIQNVRECDGAENQERFHEPSTNVDRQKDRFSGHQNGNEDNGRFERAKPNKPQNENPKAMSNGSPKNYANRPEFDNRRNSDTNKRPISQKHIIPRFNKRPNRSRNNHNGKRMIGVDKNDNWESTTVDSSSGSLSTDSSSKMPEKVVNKPTFLPITSEDFVGFNPTIPDAIPFPLNSSTKMNFVYWNSPFEFFMQLKSMEGKCEEMMHQIQQYYRKRTAIQQKVPVGSLVIVRHKDDRVIKRARVIDYNQQRDKYRVQFIDYGNKAVCSLTDMYEMEKSFTKLPAIAMCCTFESIILNKSLIDIQERVRSFFDLTVNVECKMIQQDQDKNVVEVHVNGTNLRDLLIRENYLNNLPKDICLKRLVGQTLMAYVTAVTDLNSFQATFYGCDIAFMCSYKDLSLVKKNPQLSEQLRAAKKQHVRVKIESIGKDNVLMLSIYLPNLDQDNGLPDICNYPIFNNEISAIIGHVEPPFIVYIHNSAHHNKIQQLLDELFDAYENKGTVCSAPQFNQTYAVQSSHDSNYYRCRVEEFLNDDQVNVRMIDYGNLEVVKKDGLKLLSEKFAAPISVFAQKMFIPAKFAENYSIEHLDVNVGPKVRILDTYKTHFICDLLTDNTSMIDSLERSSMAKRLDVNELKEMIERFEQEERQQSNESEMAEQIVAVETVPLEKCAPLDPPMEVVPLDVTSVTQALPMNITVNTGSECSMETSSVKQVNDENVSARLTAFITHVDHPNRFYMQLDSDSDAIATIQETLQIVAPQFAGLSDFRAGQMCIAQYTMDEQWYRGRIIDTDGEITSIQFIDWGNTDTITDNSLLKAPDCTLFEREALAMACSLPVEPCGSTEWAESASKKLRDLLADHKLEFESISKDRDVNYVKVFVEERDLVKELIQEQLAEPLEIIHSGEVCFVSHINSLSDFFIQVDSDTEVLQKIELHLAQNVKCNGEVLKSPSAGIICAALFDDGEFYRARILQVLTDSTSYEVEFLDYGNTFVTSEVRLLMPEIAQLPHLRKRCYLKLPNDVQNWSDTAEQQFKVISDDGATKFKVQLIKPGKSACIELFTDDGNMSDVLGELCEKKAASPIVIDDQDSTIIENTASLSIHSISDFGSGKQNCLLAHAASPSDFYIHFTAKMDDLQLISAELSKIDELEKIDQYLVEVGAIVAALFPDDGYYYRAKVIECLPHGINVIFIDYGNNCLVTQIRKLPSMISTIIPLAAHCTLANDLCQQFSTEDNNRFLQFMQEEPEPTFQVEAISTTATITTIQLYREGLDVLAYIRKMRDEQNAQDSVVSMVLSDIIEEATTTCE